MTLTRDEMRFIMRAAEAYYVGVEWRMAKGDGSAHHEDQIVRLATGRGIRALMGKASKFADHCAKPNPYGGDWERFAIAETFDITDY